MEINGEGFRGFAAFEATLDEADRFVGSSKIAWLARFVLPELLGGRGAERPNLLLVGSDDYVAMVDHFLRHPNARILASSPAGGGFQRDEFPLDDGEEVFARSNRPRATGGKAGKIKGWIIQFALRKILMPEPKSVEAVAGQHATVEIAAVIRDESFHF